MRNSLRCTLRFFNLVIVMTSSLCQVQGQGLDLTIKPEAVGKLVVDATLSRFRSPQSTLYKLGDFNEFLRRVACVETKFGMEEITFHDEYHGGIWQVDKDQFELTKTFQNGEALRSEIESRFGIQWTDVESIDLRKPLYSALAARLLISTFLSNPPNNAQVDDQAAYWKQHYDTPAETGTKQDFIDCVNELDDERCMVSRLDLAFVVDGSGSVGYVNFNLAKTSVKQIIEAFEIGPDRIRVGFIQYASNPVIEFRLNDHMDKDTLLSAIDGIGYRSGGTATGRAINATVNDLYAEGRGARPAEEDIPRVAIIMTDGQSGDNVLAPADRARAQDITLFAIGIGGYVLSELQEIANDPDNEYVFEATNFDVVKNIQSLVAQGACKEPITLSNDIFGEPVQNTLPIESELYIEIPLPPSNEMTITLNATVGQITAYFSTEVTNPNEAFYQWFAQASEDQPIAQVFINVTEQEARRGKRQAEIIQVYGTIINTYNASTGDASNINSTAEPFIPETVFTLLAEEGDTRIYIITTELYYTTSEPTTQDIVTTERYYTTSEPTTQGIITTEVYGTTIEFQTQEITDLDQLITLEENTRAPKASILRFGILVIAGFVIGILIFIIVVVAVTCLVKRRNRKKPDVEGTNMDEVNKKYDKDEAQDNKAYTS